MTPAHPVRRATAADLPEIARVDGRAFGVHYTPADLEDFRPLYDPDRFLLALDGPQIVGVTGAFGFAVTLPGGVALPAEGVTWVSVATTHRRRGVLRSLMTAQHRGLVAAGVPLGVLTASEGGIYGRFGYGVATVTRDVEIDRRLVRFRDGVPDPGGVRLVEPDEARWHAPAVHRHWCAITPGALARSEAWWDELLRDREHRRGGASALFHLAHPDGYAAYRIAHGSAGTTCRVTELVAVTDAAHAALWRVLLGLDLVATVATARACPPDDPLPLLLADPRQVRTTGVYDGMWARILDVPAVLAARRYAVEIDLVLEVDDPFLGRGGRFRLRGGPDGAECAAVGRSAAATIPVAALGSLVFGAHRAHPLARAGLLDAAPRTVTALDAAFGTDRAPVSGTDF